MKLNNQNVQSTISPNGTLSWLNLLAALLSRWYWILLSFVIFLLLGWVSRKIIKPRYKVEATLQYSDAKSIVDHFSPLETPYFSSTINAEILAEKYKITAKQVIHEALLRTYPFFCFHRLKDFRKIDTYPYVPLETEVLFFDETIFEEGVFVLNEDLTLTYQVPDQQPVQLAYQDTATIKVSGLHFRIHQVLTEPGFEYQFTYAANSRLVKEIAERVVLKDTREHISIMKLSFTHTNPAFATDFLKQLLYAYEKYDLSEKRLSTERTLQFIQQELHQLSDSIQKSSLSLLRFRRENELGDVFNEGKEIDGTLRLLHQEQQRAMIQRNFLKQVSETVNGIDFEKIDFLPIGWDENVDKVLVGLLNQYNELVAERLLLLTSRLISDPAVQHISRQLAQLKQQIVDNLQFQTHTNDTLFDFIQSELDTFTQRRRSLPFYEEQYSTLSKDHKVNETSYAQLLNKQLETSLIQSGIIPSFKVINTEKVEHIFPKKVATLGFFAILGLLIGCIAVLLIRYRNRTFHMLDNLPLDGTKNIVGIIPRRSKLKMHTPPFLVAQERSVFTESFKTLRMQLAWQQEKSEKGTVMVITSAAAHEGKSFVAFNLGVSIAGLGKRVLLIDADLRRPSLHTYLDTAAANGLQDYLMQDLHSPKEFIQKTVVSHLDCLYSNPNEDGDSSEWLMSNRMDSLLQWAKEQYDFVLIDTAPIGLVADAYTLLPKANCVLFIIRWLYSKQSAGHFAHSIQSQMKLDNFRVVINDYYKDPLYISFDNDADVDSWTPGYYGNSKFGDGYYHSY